MDDGKRGRVMTKELAIRILSTRDKYGVPCGYTSGYQEALDMAIDALQRTSNAHPTHECVKPTHSCVEPVGNSDQFNRTCANCKHYTEEHLCVFWSYFGFEPNDCCSRWEGADNE